MSGSETGTPRPAGRMPAGAAMAALTSGESMSHLEDRLAIHDLFTRYATALDDGEVETVVACIAAQIDPGGQHARATAYLLVLISQGDGHRTLPPGRYECALAKHEGAWRFTQRAVFHDHDYTLEEA